MKYNPRDENSIKAVLAKANVVINLIGIEFYRLSLLHINPVKNLEIIKYVAFIYLWAGREYETRNYSFEEVNHHMAEQLAMVHSSMHFDSNYSG